MVGKKLKVVWICHFSDSKIRAHIHFSRFYYLRVIKKLLGRSFGEWQDMAVWVSNAISEFEKYDDIDLTVVFPHAGIVGKKQEFSINGVNYKCFRSEDDSLWWHIKQRFFKKIDCNYNENRRIIRQWISDISPDVIHLIGAENPYYSMAAYDFPENIVSVVSLQTLMSDPAFKKNYPIDKDEYDYRVGIEKSIICKCKYIATPIIQFREIIKKDICPTASFLDMTLAVGQDVDKSPARKEYDFVYFAANINKAADYAIEAFALAFKTKPDITLNISGAYSPDYKQVLDRRIQELGIKDNVFFTGAQPSHSDVLRQIRKSRYALLPLKIDLISGTIREAMACGLPVVSTITPATPQLNEDRECVLLSPSGDFASMAQNMIRLISDDSYASLIRENAYITIQEKYSNTRFMKGWHDSYLEILNKNAI